MEKIIEILTKIENTKDCIVSKLVSPIRELPFEFDLPKDLKYYLENYTSIELFQSTGYSIKIVGLSDFKRANPVIVGEDAEYDISHNWYIIANADNTQYITIDLTKNKLGRCYDSFWDCHGVVGEQAVIAKSFTELL
ncbi:MAG TPA: SMI1/KNR4 family protein, partial [Bacillales bacterium]|nr:SMI1/KNR4 family protein [Bacillales bacterium]